MKYIVLLVLGFMFGAPSMSFAHGTMMDFNSLQTGPEMMRYVEDQALQNDELHEEMEDLMVKMMTGELSEQEANRIIEFMDEYPGPMGMMMNRYGIMDGNWQSGYGNMINGSDWGMMDWGSGWNAWAGAWVWFVFLSFTVWFIVGVLASIWLWKQIQKK